jgi:hypothetical protein
MADQQKTRKQTIPKDASKTKTQADKVKASEPAVVEVASPPPMPASAASPKKSVKKGKLLPKNKHRLPRRQKKALQKAATRL